MHYVWNLHVHVCLSLLKQSKVMHVRLVSVSMSVFRVYPASCPAFVTLHSTYSQWMDVRSS